MKSFLQSVANDVLFAVEFLGIVTLIFVLAYIAEKFVQKRQGTKEKIFTTKEFDLLTFLAQNPNHVFTREQLLDHIWGYEYAGDTRTVDVHIKRLREKLEGVSEQWCLKTVWGVGYKFELLN